MRRLLLVLSVTLFGVFGLAGTASAGSPHFVSASASVSADGSTLTAVFKEAGLGDESQIVVELDATAQCVNPGGNDPAAGNKQSFQASVVVPVQNGHADGQVSVTAVLQPSCVPPMTIAWSAATLTDQTNGLTVTLL